MELGFGGARCALAVTCVFGTLAIGGTARAEMRVAWDCFLPESEVECRDVAGAFFATVPGVARADAEVADLSIQLRATRLARGQRYLADFAGTPFAPDAGQEPVVFALSEHVPDAAGRDRALMLLVALLQRGTVPYMHVATPGKGEGGVLRLEAAGNTAAGQGSGDAADEAGSQAGWYGRPSVAGELVSAGVRVISLEASFELGWSDPSWRWLTTASGGYRHLDLELPGTTLRGGFVQARGRSVLARSLGSGFGLGLVGAARREPQNNLESRAQAGVGLEWMHRELLRADEGNFGARYVMSGIWDRYATATVHGQTSRLYPHQSLSLFARWHLDAIDVEANVAGGVVADQPELWDVGGELAVTLRLAEGLELEIGGAVIYRGGAVHEPADLARIDPVASAVAGSDFGELTYTSRVSIAYSFGNDLLRAQDQRWR